MAISPNRKNMMNWLQAKKGGLLTIGFEIDADVKKDLLTWDMSEETYRRELNDFTNRVGRELAEHARDRMYKWISKGGLYDIGDTNQSAENLTVGSQGSKASSVWYVYEAGEDTAGNTAIRKGVRPNPSASDDARNNSEAQWNKKADAMKGNKRVRAAAIYRSRNPYFAAIEDWAKRKGLRPKQDTEPINEDDYVLEGKPFPKKASRKDKRTQWRSMLWALWHTWKVKGQSVAYKDVLGKPYFDYAAEYAKSKSARYQAEKRLKSKEGEGLHGAPGSVASITTAFVYSQLYKRMGLRTKMGSRTLGKAIE